MPLKGIEIFLSQNYLWILIAVMLSLFLSVFIYKKTNPIINKYLKAFLLSLRFLALTILILIIFEATIGLTFERSVKPAVAIAIDRSASMAITDAEGSRIESVKKILTGNLTNKLKSDFDIHYYAFDSRAREIAAQDLNSMTFEGDATVISETLEQITTDLAENHLSAILLISDGNYNKGGNPAHLAAEMKIPIFPIAVGSSQPIPDISIKEVGSNPIAYLQESSPINFTVRNEGFSQILAKIHLKEAGEIIASKEITLPPSPAEVTTRIDYVPARVGMHKLELEVTSSAEEKTLENNKNTLYLNVLKGKLNILLVAGRVTPDVSFIQRHLKSSDRYHLQVAVEPKTGKILPDEQISSNLAETDIFLLLYYPSMRSADFYNQIVEDIAKRKKPVLLYVDRNTAFDKLRPLQEFLPVRLENFQMEDRQAIVSLSAQGRLHPVTQIKSEQTELMNLWMQLPPINSSVIFKNLWPNTETLIAAHPSKFPKVDNRQQWPVIAIREHDEYKSAIIVAEGLWKWDLPMWGIGNTDDLYAQLVNNLVHWLERSTKSSLVRLKLDKQKFNIGEKISLQTDVYDEKYNPINNATVFYEIRHKGVHKEFLGEKASQDGQYLYDFYADKSGDYQILVTAKADNRTVGSDTSNVTVGEYSIELSNTNAQVALLQSLANLSHGHYFDADSMDDLNSYIQAKPVKQEIIREMEIWNHHFTLILVITLLTVEWFVRKRKGMV